MLRKNAGRKNETKVPADESSSPWFFFCGCPTTKSQLKSGGGGMVRYGDYLTEPQPQPRDCDEPPAAAAGKEIVAPKTEVGSPSTAAKDTTAGVLHKVRLTPKRRFVHDHFDV